MCYTIIYLKNYCGNENKLNQMLPGNQILKSLELLAMVKPDEQSIAEPQENVNAGFPRKCRMKLAMRQ